MESGSFSERLMLYYCDLGTAGSFESMQVRIKMFDYYPWVYIMQNENTMVVGMGLESPPLRGKK